MLRIDLYFNHIIMARPKKEDSQSQIIDRLQQMNKDLVMDNLDLLEACEELKAELVSIEKDHKSDAIFKVIMAVLITLWCCLILLGAVGK